jgi:tetratricopeptide (TPR) repeat protein
VLIFNDNGNARHYVTSCNLRISKGIQPFANVPLSGSRNLEDCYPMARQYKAFISYSWSDKQWAGWLHHALETYHTPKELVGQSAVHGGEIPARLHPIFKDREEEAAGAGITAAIETGMGASEFLIVICSPRSAKSEWVSKEIAWFKRNRDPRKILAVVVDGEPGASFMAGREDEECFPKSLLYNVDEDLSITGEREDSPLAADARYEGDGKNGAKLKLAAAMLGVGLDDLVKRDERRQAKRTRMIVSASLALAVVMTGLAGLAIVSRNAAVTARAEAEFQRGEAEGLVEFMLTDLRKRLDAVGRLDVLDAVGGRALKYYSAQDAKKLNPDALGRRARALLLVGEMQNMRGDLDGALAAYKDAARTTEEQLNRDPEKPQRLFDHSQSVFWVGFIGLQTGKTDVAESYFRQYLKYATKLVAKEPKKPEWQLELAYAHSNLGTVLLGKGEWKAALANFDRTLALFSPLAAQKPDDSALVTEISNAMAWRADALKIGGDVGGALAQRQAQAKLLEKLMEREPQIASAKNDYSTAMRELGNMASLSGQSNTAMKSIQKALAMSVELRNSDPQNAEYKLFEIMNRLDLAAVHLERCDQNGALVQINSALPMLQSIPDPDKNLRQEKEQIDLQLRVFAFRGQMLAGNGGDLSGALRDLIDQKTMAMARMKPGRDDPLYFARAEIAFGDSFVLGGDRQKAAAAWAAAKARLALHPSQNDARVQAEIKRIGVRTQTTGRFANKAAARKILFGCAS